LILISQKFHSDWLDVFTIKTIVNTGPYASKLFLNNDKYRRIRLSGVALMMIKKSVVAMLFLAWWGFQPACFFVIQRLPGNRNISFQTPKIIRRNAIHGTRITNRVMKIFSLSVFSLRKMRRACPEYTVWQHDRGGDERGLEFSVSARMTTGPVVAWRYDGTAPMMINEFGDSATTQSLTDPLWHASVSTLGWRVDTQYGDLRPWAQISYNQQFGENQWKSQFGMPQTPAPAQNGSWMDVTVGTDMPFNTHMAAYASLAQGSTPPPVRSFYTPWASAQIFRVVTFLNVTITSRIQ
jgi:hypothetical protein